MRRRSEGLRRKRVVRRHDRDDVAEGDRELRHARPEPDRELHRLARRRSSSPRRGSRRSSRSGARRARRARSSCRRARRAAGGRRSAAAASPRSRARRARAGARRRTPRTGPRRARSASCPPKSGSRGNGASLIVPGRRKCRNAVNGGQRWKPSGPLMQPNPSTSTRQPQRNAFWNAIPSPHHDAEGPGAAEAGREAHEEHPAEDDQAQLDGVEEVGGERAARCPSGRTPRSRGAPARRSPWSPAPAGSCSRSRAAIPPPPGARVAPHQSAF